MVAKQQFEACQQSSDKWLTMKSWQKMENTQFRRVNIYLIDIYG